MSTIRLQPTSINSQPIIEQPSGLIMREFSQVKPKEQDEYFTYSKYKGSKIKTEGGKLKRKTRKHRKSRKYRNSRKFRSYKK
jgi:hypothetical protein